MSEQQDLSTDNLVIEVTRKCNLHCKHCLRGDAQNTDIKTGAMFQFLTTNNIEYISTVTFTGGEPTLNLPAINEFIDICTTFDIDVRNFYIVVNGVEIPDEFILTVSRLWAFCSENDISQVEVSESDFYYDQDSSQINKLGSFKCFSRKHTGDNLHLIREGRAVEWSNEYANGEGRNIEIDDENRELVEEYDEIAEYGQICGTIYLNVNGDIVSCCDLSYESQDLYKLGNVEDKTLLEMLAELNDKYNKEV